VLLAARGRSRRREPPRSGLPQFPFARVWLGAALDVRLAHPPRPEPNARATAGWISTPAVTIASRAPPARPLTGRISG